MAMLANDWAVARKLWGAVFLVFMVWIPTGSCSAPKPEEGPAWRQYEYKRVAMGVQVRIVTYAQDLRPGRSAEPKVLKAVQDAFDRIDELESKLSDYRSDSELSQLNQQVGGTQFEISADLFDVLDRSFELAEVSDGSFDPTVGPLVKLWRTARSNQQLPNDQQLQTALSQTGHRKLRLSQSHGRYKVRKASGSVQLDLGGIGKGFAADQALQSLRSAGLPNSLVEIGGDIALGEAPFGRNKAKSGWKIALSCSNAAPTKTLVLKNCGVATSGDSEQALEVKGVRHSHVLDPRDGRALQNSGCLTVVAKDATSADGLASALSVLGPNQTTTSATSSSALAGYLQQHSAEVHWHGR